MTDREENYSRKRIVYADGRPFSRAAVLRLLCGRYIVTEVSDSSELLGILHPRGTEGDTYKSPAAVILDISLPGMSVYKLLEELRDDSALSGIPLIAVLPSCDDVARRRAVDSGAWETIDGGSLCELLPGIIDRIIRNEPDRVGSAGTGKTASLAGAISERFKIFAAEYDAEAGIVTPLSHSGFFPDSSFSFSEMITSYRARGVISEEDSSELLSLEEKFRYGAPCSEYVFEVAGEICTRWFCISFSDCNKNGETIIFLEDMTDEYKRETELLRRAETDSVTSILNRATFEFEVRSRLESIGRDAIFAFVMMDVDNFKNVNDTLGHIRGDSLLFEIAKTLKSMLRCGDIFGRLGGDEFGIFIGSFPDKEALSGRMESLRIALQKVTEGELHISASFGISLFAQDGTSFEELYEKADVALYKSKKTGRNKFLFFTKDMLSSE